MHPDARRSRMAGQSEGGNVGRVVLCEPPNPTNIHECELAHAKVYVGVGSQNRL